MRNKQKKLKQKVIKFLPFNILFAFTSLISVTLLSWAPTLFKISIIGISARKIAYKNIFAFFKIAPKNML